MTNRKGDEVVIDSRQENNKNFQVPQNESEPNEKILIADAAVGFAVEKALGPWEAVKAYPQAILWALVMAACVIMEGYDTALLGSFFAYRTSL
jgi:SP family general alpha glucoside:H+ symporter-like MFS transporter